MSIIIQVPDHILYEDNYILVVNKPCSLMVEPDRNGHPNLLQQVQKYVKKSLHPNKEVYVQHIHRLDRPVSGIVLFAKKKSMLKELSEQFAQRTVKKYYQALTRKVTTNGKGALNHWHFKDSKNKKAILYKEEQQETSAVSLGYSTSDYNADYTLWDIQLNTGKYHQIRAQLSFEGYPILGDECYKSTDVYAPNAIALHACKLEFVHPVSKESMRLEAQPNWLV
ncbi:RluA family pseudouridine synthase [Cytophaga hutchinsonii]|jgi:RluA family pseudouridine synthase|uniref:Ribosomal pseudouridine synthase C, large subunit n=1 Tax=Cytophaga hutchinsonii (strain ATCC 33406 / DSM 1761 / CIP 103989 / NBRC 15051 / NCIMB 9469 / D465) TaxID=269798 RepID=A0A6N4SXB4_CYTH3|nr:RluA family pseudouridine synthase [Cytophaga hutchinsonii]ABG60999.1 ribosomal pseudouridine synthase C, large subunit [Cytophaga hutchinsonii ATCC 33406]SFX44085.1 ribosomal large subunit pseudouridine synthase D [Cytophaga hutchinsonii ATCC 33406]